MRFLIFLAFTFTTLPLFGQTPDSTPCACCAGPFSDFDFWIGEWEVFDTTGTQLGTNSIQPKVDQCILEENWVGSSGFTGSSYNYYDSRDSAWHQLWIDQQGGVLEMTGGLESGSMVMQTTPQTSQKGVLYVNRITWTPKPDGSVTQRWEAVSESDGSVLSLIFFGIYRRKEKD